jgi:hypothetical protein
MTINELSSVLKEMYENAPKGDRVAMIHLFGIKYANEIRSSEYSPREILKNAHMHESYQVEINKGINLAKYVNVK